ncbi:hypothetical protein ACKKBF_B37745 [Auxenochlorella protothecoides x Auxenochlorella symbiontica]
MQDDPSKALQQGAPGSTLCLPATSFYAKSKLDAVEERILRFLTRVHVRHKQPEAVEAEIWHVFPTQQAAIDCADGLNVQRGSPLERTRVWSMETSGDGKRRFLVSTVTNFYRRYSDMLPHHRHYYEIIREGQPCHIYFDLEFSRALNPDKDGPAAIQSLLEALSCLLQEELGMSLDIADVVELDSSTPSKFSRHLILRIPGHAFASNAHVGALVRQLCARARKRGPDGPLAIVADSPHLNGGLPLLVDEAVYSRNRAFRLLLSSKAGKEATLQCSGRYGGSQLTAQELFMASLICVDDPNVTLLTWQADELDDGGQNNRTSSHPGSGRHGSRASTTGNLRMHHGPCPFPELAAFITAVCSQDGAWPRAGIRSWAMQEDASLVLYNIRGCRYCGNLGREHRSNGVFYVVDLQGGGWTQRCYDPACRGYRSPVTALPEAVLATCQARAHGLGSGGAGPSPAWVACDLSDAELIQAVDRYEALHGGTVAKPDDQAAGGPSLSPAPRD